MKTELLIVSNEQYGYHIDSYKYCQYLKDKYDITYICFNKGLKEIPFDKISVKYIPWKGSWIFRSCRFIITVLKMILTMSSSGLVFIVYFNGFTIFKYLLPIRRYILDVRTLSVSKGKYKRLLEDYFLKLSIRFYRYKTCISEGVVDKLGLKNDSGTYILPLGADILSDVEKDFSSMRLLYVGTLTGRNILLTLKGFHRYWLSVKTVNLSYDIIGEGEEYDLLQDYIVQNNLSAIVRLHGYIHQSELKRFYDNSLTLESRTEDTYYKLTDGIGNGYDMTLSGEGATSVTIFDSSKKEIAEITLDGTTYVKLESETECYYILVPGTETPGANVTLSRTEHIGALTGSVLLGEYHGVRNGSSFFKINVTADGYTWEGSTTVYNATTAPVETTNGYYTFTVQQDAEGKIVKTFTGNGEYMWIDEVNSSYGTSYNVYFMTQASKASYNSSSLSGEGAGTLDYDETGEGVYIQSLVESLVEGSPRVYAIKIDGVVYLDVDVVFTSGTELDGSGATYTVSYNGTELGTGTYETGRLVWTPAA